MPILKNGNYATPAELRGRIAHHRSMADIYLRTPKDDPRHEWALSLAAAEKAKADEIAREVQQ